MSGISRKSILRLSIASGCCLYYITTNMDPLIKITYRWKIREMSMFKYIAGIDESKGLINKEPFISQSLQNIIDQVKARVDISPENLKKINLIPLNVAMPTRTIGHSESGSAYVSIPDYLNVNSIEDLTADKLSSLIQNYYKISKIEKEEWLTGHGRLLIESFIMSEKAKKFLIAHQLYAAEYSPTFIKSIVVFMNAYAFFIMMNLVLNVVQPKSTKDVKLGKFFVLSLIPFSIIYLFWKIYSLYIDTHHQSDADARAISNGKLSVADMMKLTKEIEKRKLRGNLSNDVEILEKIYTIDLEMVQGAIEYYSKLINRHLALKEICANKDKWYEFSASKFTYNGSFKSKSLSIDFTPDPYNSLNQIQTWLQFTK